MLSDDAAAQRSEVLTANEKRTFKVYYDVVELLKRGPGDVMMKRGKFPSSPESDLGNTINLVAVHDLDTPLPVDDQILSEER